MLIVTLTLALTGCAETITGDATAGADVYAANCASCHGADGTGDDANGFPNLVEEAPEAAEIEEYVRDGEGVMPAFEGTLDDQEIADVVAYVESL